MSRTIKGAKGPGYEYWGKRAYSPASPGKKNKVITHRLERARSKKLDKAEQE